MEQSQVFELSELDQIMPRLYVRWLLCFPLSTASASKQSIIDSIRLGAIRTLNQIPVLRGHLVPKTSDPSRLEVHLPNSSQDVSGYELKVQHLDGEADETISTYDSLRRHNFPVSELPDSIVTPPDVPGVPVFDMMATFIRGGFLLCIKCHHAVVDGGGLGLVIKFLAQQCHTASRPLSESISIPIPSMDRGLLPLNLGESSIQDVGFTIIQDGEKHTAPAREYSSMTSHIFKFSQKDLKELKELCAPDICFITSHDALTALLYGAVSYARSLRLTGNSSDEITLESKLTTAVNGRNRLGKKIPSYAGNVCLYATFAHPLRLARPRIPSEDMKNLKLLSSSLELPALAAQTHTAVTAVTHDYITSTIALAASQDNISRMQPSSSDFYQGTDFFITSGVDYPVFKHEWWPGGIVEALRIPLKAQWDGSCGVLAAKDRSQGLEVLLGLRGDDMNVVKEILFAFGAYIA